MNSRSTNSLSARLMSLDAFRGFTIVAMLLVNNKGSNDAFPHQFHHAKWGEFPTFTDMIFPWFLLMVGCALPYSRASQFKKGLSYPQYFFRCFKRALLLVVLGCLIFTSLNHTITIQYGGVLQPIGCAFFAGAILYELGLKWRMAAASGLIVLYGFLLLFVPIPGAEHSMEPNKNIISYINTHYFARFNLQGLTSIMPMTALVLIGTYLGEIYRSTLTPINQIKKTSLVGSLLVVIGLAFQFAIPLSKDIWSPTYIVFSAGTGIVLLSLFYLIIDIKGRKAWSHFFIVFGMNAITAYFLSIIIRLHTFQEWSWEKGGPKVWNILNSQFQSFFGPTAGAWLFTISYILLWWAILSWMYKRKIFWRV